MKLIACSNCHAQYDVADLPADSTFDCRCGTSVQVVALKGEDARVQRCSACGALAQEQDENCDYCGAAIVHLADRGGLICPECLARNADDARFCLACGVGFDPEPIGLKACELSCPCCNREMVTQLVASLEIAECAKCLGIWAPEDRFEALVDRMTRVVNQRYAEGAAPAPRVEGGNPFSTRVEYRSCPECNAHMNRRNFKKRSGVIIDQCNAHGTWLDAHELEQIAGFVLSGRAEKADRVAATEAAEQERAAARAAMQKTILGDRFEQNETSTFGPGRNWSSAGSILEFFQSLLV